MSTKDKKRINVDTGRPYKRGDKPTKEDLPSRGGLLFLRYDYSRTYQKTRLRPFHGHQEGFFVEIWAKKRVNVDTGHPYKRGDKPTKVDLPSRKGLLFLRYDYSGTDGTFIFEKWTTPEEDENKRKLVVFGLSILWLASWKLVFLMWDSGIASEWAILGFVAYVVLNMAQAYLLVLIVTKRKFINFSKNTRLHRKLFTNSHPTLGQNLFTFSLYNIIFLILILGGYNYFWIYTKVDSYDRASHFEAMQNELNLLKKCEILAERHKNDWGEPVGNVTWDSSWDGYDYFLGWPTYIAWFRGDELTTGESKSITCKVLTVWYPKPRYTLSIYVKDWNSSETACDDFNPDPAPKCNP